MAYYLRNAANQLRTFDQAFEPRQSGDPISSVGTPYNNSSGQDIINDYVPLSFGGSQIDSDSHYHANNNADLRQIFAAAGTVGRVQAPWDGEIYLTQRLVWLEPEPTLNFSVSSDGSFSIYGSGSGAEPSGDPLIGDWLITGGGSDYEVRFTVISNTGVNVDNEASSYSTVSQTRTIGVVLDQLSGSGSARIIVEFRRVGQSNVVSTSSLSLTLDNYAV